MVTGGSTPTGPGRTRFTRLRRFVAVGILAGVSVIPAVSLIDSTRAPDRASAQSVGSGPGSGPGSGSDSGSDSGSAANPQSGPTPDPGSDPALVLARRYAPVVAIAQQSSECGPGEPYLPAPVEAVLGRSDVTLVAPDGSVLRRAPTAADLHRLGEGYHLDLPGRPLDPGCDYERWWRSLSGSVAPTVYVRVATDADHPGRLAVQYWFWWVFNDWNDKHEGDWEMMELIFDADSVESALEIAPTTAVVAQHEGAERRPWDSTSLDRDGDHLVVYPSHGSHATYLSSNRWFGKSAATGFGCDDTRSVTTRLRPEVVLLPTELTSISGPDDPFAWLTFTGRWGEKAPSFNNGPQGPATKAQWEHPIEWVESNARDSSVALPPLGSTVTDLFCSASAAGSLLFIALLDEPIVVASVLVVILGVLGWLLRRTRWTPSDPFPVAQRRHAGQILLTALRFQWRSPRTFIGLAAFILIGGVVAGVVRRLVLAVSPLGGLAELTGESGAWVTPVALVAGAVITLPVAAVARVAACVLVEARSLEAQTLEAPTLEAQTLEARRLGELPTERLSVLLGSSLRRPAAILNALLLPVMLAVGSAILVTLPVMLWLLSRWALATPLAVMNRTSFRAALRASTSLTRGTRGRTLALVLPTLVAAHLLGPLVGAIVLLATDLDFIAVELVSAVIGAVLVPWSGVVLAYLHSDRAIAADPRQHRDRFSLS